MSERHAPGVRRQVTAGAPVGSGIPRRSLGRHLRRMRHEYGASISSVAELIGRGAGTLHRMETGSPHVVVREEDLVELCTLYRRPDMLPLLMSLAAQGRAPSWLDDFPDEIDPAFTLYLRMEAAAERLAVYRPDILSGLFQVPDYARTLERGCFPYESPARIERRVLVRSMRQRVLTREIAPLAVELLIDEAVIRRRVGTPESMASQLRYLADLPSTVRVGIVPFSRGFPCGTCPGPFTILDFGGDGDGRESEPPVVHVESYAGDLYYERAEIVRRYRRAFERIRRVALGVPESKRLLRQSAKEFDRE